MAPSVPDPFPAGVLVEENASGSGAEMGRQDDSEHTVPLDQDFKTMRESGNDMKIKDKETSRGGLAVNVIEC